MVMYKQNRGLEASGTIGPQSTGPMMAPKKKPQYSVQSVGGNFELGGVGNALSQAGKGVGSFINTLGQAGVLGGQSKGNLFTYTPPSFAGTQPSQQPAQAQRAPQMPSAPMMAPKDTRQFSSERFIPLAREMANRGTPLTGRETYDDLEGLYSQYGPRQLSAASVANALGGIDNLVKQNRAIAASQQPFIGENYRPPVESAAAKVQNPFTPKMQALMEAKAIQQAEEQSAVTAQRLNAQLAGTGLMSGGPSGLSAGIARQVAMGTEANRLNALREIGLQVPQMRAEFDLRQAGMIDPYTQFLAREARDLARQPGELDLLREQGTAARLQNQMAGVDLTVQGNQDVIKARIEKAINDGIISGAEAEAARQLLRINDPDAWYNSPLWKLFEQGTIAFLGGAAQGLGGSLARGAFGGGGTK